MQKRFFAIFSDGVMITKKGERLVFEKRAKKVSVLVSHLRGVLVFGRASISSEVINFLLKEDIPVFFLTKFGKLKGFLISETLASNNNNRIYQYELFTSKRLEVAKFFVLKKLEEIELHFLLNLSQEKDLLKEAQTLDQVRGIEGNASKKMFEEFKKELGETEFTFKGRDYYPPKDEVNALLSLAYTLVYLTAIPTVIAVGLDPYLPFLHSKRGTHNAFCSDLMEPIRPFITYKLLQEIKRGLFKRSDFQKETSKGFYLKTEALNRFLNWYENLQEEVLKRLSSTLSEFLVEFR